MTSNPVKQKIHRGGRAFGTFVFEFCTAGIGRIIAQTGAEFTLFDMEHTGWTVETIRLLIATTRPTGVVPLVRIPATEYHFVARALDMGAMGVMVPMVESAAQAASIVAAAKYPPIGRRGAAFGVAHDDYTGGDIAAKMRQANAQTLLIAQVETAAGIRAVDLIAAVDGIDVLWVGQADLSTSLGIPGQLNHPDFQAALRQVVDACRRHGKTAGYMALDLAEAQERLDQGFRMIAYGGDLWLFQRVLREGIATLRQHGHSEDRG